MRTRAKHADGRAWEEREGVPSIAMARPVWNPAAIQRLLDFGTAEAPTPLDIATLDTVIFFLYDDDTPAEQKKAVRVSSSQPHHHTLPPSHPLHKFTRWYIS